jgi:hypothetical protein
MPILSAITAISKRYPDIALDPDKHSFEKKLSILIGIFSLEYICLALAQPSIRLLPSKYYLVVSREWEIPGTPFPHTYCSQP